jgi:hypothetical protein
MMKGTLMMYLTKSTRNLQGEKARVRAEAALLQEEHLEKGCVSRTRTDIWWLSVNQKDLEKKAHELCRLALFTEYRRLILKREDINKKGNLCSM